MIQISDCTTDEVSEVMAFIREHWAADHILSSHRPLMDWQHGPCDQKKEYHWILARAGEDVLGILGYIPSSRFDERADSAPVLWLALWKVRSDIKPAGLGLRLLTALTQKRHCAIGVLGINPEHPPMYRALGYRTGELNHHVLFNSRLPQRVARVPEDFQIPRPALRAAAALVELDRSELAELDDADWDRSLWQNRTHKTPRYFRNRYGEHPVYRYSIFRVVSGTRTCGLLAARVAQAGTNRVLRIVDFSGERDAFARCGRSIERLLVDRGLEYADLWEAGLDSKALAAGGFHKVDPNGAVVVPNYFEPFVQSNSRIEYACKGFERLDYAVMRGDGDQDRPNRVS